MDEMPSSEFRKRYATLLRPTIITVNRHPIGVWQPNKGEHEPAWREAVGADPVPVEIARAFNSRPFQPVPKRSAK